jgi:2-iminobutanoate/2-iminopropanoate deaminase
LNEVECGAALPGFYPPNGVNKAKATKKYLSLAAKQDNEDSQMESPTKTPARVIEVPNLKAGGHYSAAVAAGGFVFVSGQTPRDEARQIVGDTIEEQTAAALDNVAKALAAAGASMTDIVKVTIYLTDLNLFPRFNVVYATRFPDFKPARTTVECGLQGVMVEIDAVAHINV